MRKSKIRKQSKEPIAKVQRRLWVLCRLVADRIYPRSCYTCDQKNLEGRNCQLGHMIPKGSCGASLRYEINNLRWQCAKCNIWNGGMGAEFMRNMIIREGQEYVDAIFAKRNLNVKAHDYYLMLCEKYKLRLEELNAS